MTDGPNYNCVQCDGRLSGEDGVFECERCGQRVVEPERISEIAEDVRAEGFDELATRLEAAARAAGEAGNDL